jgi:prepilin-type N-terminal cleavage/methylation domain-containing protein
MIKKIQIDIVAPTFNLLRLLLAVTIWSCHAWVAPIFRLFRGLTAEPLPQQGALEPKFLNPNPRSRNKFGMTKRAEMNSHVMLNSFQHLVCFFSAFNRRGLNNKTSPPRPHQPLNPLGFTLIEVIAVMIIIGILAAIMLPRIDFGGTSSKASVAGAANMVASDIRYTQECAMANRVSKSIAFTSGQNSYTFPATIPSTSSLDPSGRLPSGVTTGTTITFTFNSLGEPTGGGGSSVTVSAGGITGTITVTQYTGKVSIS